MGVGVDKQEDIPSEFRDRLASEAPPFIARLREAMGRQEGTDRQVVAECQVMATILREEHKVDLIGVVIQVEMGPLAVTLKTLLMQMGINATALALLVERLTK